MNKRRHITLFVAALLLAVNFAFPPWASYDSYRKTWSREGYGYILEPSTDDWSININQLAVQALLIIAVSAVVYFGLGLLPEKHESEAQSMLTRAISSVVNLPEFQMAKYLALMTVYVFVAGICLVMLLAGVEKLVR